MDILDSRVGKDIESFVQDGGGAPVGGGEHMPVEGSSRVAPSLPAPPSMPSRNQQHSVGPGLIAAKPEPTIGDLPDIHVHGKVLQQERQAGECGGYVCWVGGGITAATGHPCTPQIVPGRGCASVKTVAEKGLPVSRRQPTAKSCSHCQGPNERVCFCFHN